MALEDMIKKLARKDTELDGKRVDSLDQKKIRTRIQSLEAKSEDPNFDIVRMNTKLNSKPSIIEDQGPRRSKTAKKVTFDDIAPSAAEYFDEKENEPFSFMLAPLTVDTGSELSITEFLPQLSFEAEEKNIQPAVDSPLQKTLLITENNTIIKRKKVEEKREEFKEMGYYLGKDTDSEESLEDVESPQHELRRLPHRDFSELKQSRKISSSAFSDSKEELQVFPEGKDFVKADSDSTVSDNTSEAIENSHSEKSNSPPPIEKDIPQEELNEDYHDLLSRFTRLESSHVLLQEENKFKNSKYDDLFLKFSKLEKMYAVLQDENKATSKKLANSIAENQNLTFKYENALVESNKSAKGLSNEIKILQAHVGTYKRQMEFYDREIFTN